MVASKTFALSGNTADPTGLVSGDKGKTWFNSTSNQIKYWDGSTVFALSVAGSGLGSLNGQTGNTQTLATPGASGTAPAWSSAANAHTLNIPLASIASVTAGLISNSDYNTFNGKVAGVTSGTGVSVSTTGNIATVNLATAGTVGTYAKVTTDAYGRVTAGSTLAGSDVTSALGFAPINKAGDTMSGAITLPSNGLVAGTNQLVLANGNVGIGTTNPGYNLQVAGVAAADWLLVGPSMSGSSGIEIGNSSGSSTTPYIDFHYGNGLNQDHNVRIVNSDNNRLDFSTTLGTTMTVNGGNVGIGTTSPTAILQLGTEPLQTSLIGYTVGANGEGLLFNHTQITASNAQRVADIVALGQQNGMLGGSAFRFLTNPANSNTAVERVRIDPNGNVGIGTTAPATALDVQGQIRSIVYNATSATAFNWNNGNIQYTSATCGAFTFTNMNDGGVYTLIVKSTTSGTCTFSQAGLNFRTQSTLVTASGTYTIFNFIVAGADVFVKMQRGY